MRNDRHRHQLQAVQQPGTDRRRGQRRGAIGEQHQHQRRGQREAGPRRQPAKIAGAPQADRVAGLAGGGTGQELREAHQVGVGALVEPAPACDELGAEVAEMRDGAAEAGAAEPQEDREHLGDRAGAAGNGRGRCAHGGAGSGDGTFTVAGIV